MLESAEALALVQLVNTQLETVWRGKSIAQRKQRREAGDRTRRANTPALYSIEFVKKLAPSPHCSEYFLRVMRRENSGTVASAGIAHTMQGAITVVSEYRVALDGLDTSSEVIMYLAPACQQDNGHYLYKGFAALLVHLLVYCCACARLRMHVYAEHPGMVKLYGQYATAGYASSRGSAEYVGYVINATAGGLTDAALAALKACARYRIDTVLARMTVNKDTTLDASACVGPWSGACG